MRKSISFVIIIVLLSNLKVEQPSNIPVKINNKESSVDTSVDKSDIDVDIKTSNLSEDNTIIISISNQTLTYKSHFYNISTSRWGIGNEKGSNKTPLGIHSIYRKLGQNEPIGTIFKGGASISVTYYKSSMVGDLVTSRVIWLDGKENHNNNSRDRRIYIHGTNHEENIGTPSSHGCIRMYNKDVIELFDLVDNKTLVNIID